MIDLKQTLMSKVDDKKRAYLFETYKKNKIDAANTGRMETTRFIDRNEDEVIDFYLDNVIGMIKIFSGSLEDDFDGDFKASGYLISDEILDDAHVLDADFLDVVNETIVACDKDAHKAYLWNQTYRPIGDGYQPSN